MRERWVRLRDFTFCLCEWGRPTDPLVLILHGWLDQGAAWNRVAQRLVADGFYVVAPDQRGHGQSDHTPPGTGYHFAEYLADLDALIANLNRPVQILVGHSMGGTVATLYAGLRPDRIPSLVLIEGLGPAKVPLQDAVDQMQVYLDHQIREWVHHPMDNVQAAARRLQRFNPGLPDDESIFLANRVTQEVDGRLIWTWDPRHRSRSAIAYDVDRHLTCLSRIQSVTHYVQGTRSWYIQLPDLEQRLAAIPDVRTRHEFDAGHALHIDCPIEVAGVIRQASMET